MCGIAGIWHREGVHPTDLLGMSQQLRHRGPDDEGFLLYTDKSSYTEARAHDTISALDRLPHLETIPAKTHTLGLLHRRLSIIDVSPSGHQPMALNHRFSIVFNGEIYNYLEIRKELESLGYLFKTGSDTEVILYSFEEWGPLCVDRFIGMWSFVLLDIDNQSLFISRDRFGIKPFYYSFGKDHFAFASEIKALTPLPFVSSELNIERTVEYLSFGITVDPNRPDLRGYTGIASRTQHAIFVSRRRRKNLSILQFRPSGSCNVTYQCGKRHPSLWRTIARCHRTAFKG